MEELKTPTGEPRGRSFAPAAPVVRAPGPGVHGPLLEDRLDAGQRLLDFLQPFFDVPDPLLDCLSCFAPAFSSMLPTMPSSFFTASASLSPPTPVLFLLPFCPVAAAAEARAANVLVSSGGVGVAARCPPALATAIRRLAAHAAASHGGFDTGSRRDES